MQYPENNVKPKQQTMTKYVVTAMSRLSCERETVSTPKERSEADLLCQRWKRRLRGQRKPVYWQLRVEPAEREAELLWHF